MPASACRHRRRGLSTVTPYDLGQAIVARFAARQDVLSAFTKIYHDETGDRPTMPYLVFKIPSGSPEMITDISQWDDHRVHFEAFAATQVEASTLRDAVVTAYVGQSLAFESGAMTPFVRVDRHEGKKRGRTVNGAYVFGAVAAFQTRVRTES